MKKITILIPCYNEERGIGRVIDSIPVKKLISSGYYTTEILVIDNNSSDRTSIIARQKGARVIFEKKRGKGNALITGFKNISRITDYVVMLDGDNTYKTDEILRLIEPLEAGFCDAVIGSRLGGKMKDSSMTVINRIGNWLFTFFVRQFYKVNITDTLSGFFAWKKEVIDKLAPNLNSKGFSIEAEIVTKMAKLGYRIYSVPITYRERAGSPKLSPFFDGLKIAKVLFKNLFWKKEKPERKLEKYLDYAISGLLIIIVVALIVTVNRKVKEDFTELYFNDYTNLLKYITDSGEFSFAIHNIENKPYEYDVAVTAELYDDVDSTEPLSILDINKFNSELEDGETKIFNQKFNISEPAFKKAKIEVAIKNSTQDIHFWTSYAKEFQKYDFGYGMLDCLKEAEVNPFSEVIVYARGDYAKEWPQLQFWFDGRLIETREISNTNAEPYSFYVPGKEGKHIIDIAFINDYYDEKTKEDRNLYIEKIKINKKEITNQSFIKDMGNNEESFDCQNVSPDGNLYSTGAVRIKAIVKEK